MAEHAEFNTVIKTENHTKNLLPKADRPQPSEAQQEGIDTAKANAAAERKVNPAPDNVLDESNENITDAQNLAKLNHKVDQENFTEGRTIAKNDTSKAGKRRTSKSQLDPTGNDPVSSAEVNRAATDGVNVKGGTSVTDEEVARRAADPGKAEEESDQSIADGGTGEGALKADTDAVHTNGNENKDTGEGGLADDTASPANRSVDGREHKADEVNDKTADKN